MNVDAETIKTISHRYGFVDAGITLPQRPDHFSTYLSWISDGHAKGMNYLVSEKALVAREDPRALMPECRSIIVLLARYPVPYRLGSLRASPGLQGVAAYACGDDYHTVLIEKIKRMATELEMEINHSILFRAFTDSGPLLERELAARAGLGWIGRNSCLISPEYGSYTFLAELLTDLSLTPSVPAGVDRCGNCHRCMEVCPTKAILPNRTIAAERCLSYLTIENRGEIPITLRSSLGDCIFGCDLCQLVCPWNNKKDNSRVDSCFLASERIKLLDPQQVCNLSDEDFKKIYHNSPVLRAKRRGFLRNIVLFIGNHPSSGTVDLLLNIIHTEKDPLIRAAAIWAVGQTPGEAVKRELLGVQRVETDPTIRREISRILEE
jgi:epoxyqueuosine reductase